MARGQVQSFADMRAQDREAIDKLSDEIQKLKNLLYWLQTHKSKEYCRLDRDRISLRRENAQANYGRPSLRDIDDTLNRIGCSGGL